MTATIAAAALAPGVHLHPGNLTDELRTQPVAVNATAHQLLQAINDGEPLSSITARFAAAHHLDPADATRDIERLLHQLNTLGLVNLRAHPLRRARARLRYTIGTGRLTTLPGIRRRHHINTTTIARTMTSTTRAATAPALRTAAAMLLSLIPVLLLIGPPATAVATAALIALGTATSTVVHEIGHALTLRHQTVHATASTASVHLHHPHTTRDTLTALAGPTSALTAAAALLATATMTHTPWLAPAAAPYTLHTLGLTALTTDGRNLTRRKTQPQATAAAHGNGPNQ